MMPETSMTEEINVRAPFYHVARVQCRCWRCGKATSVFAIALPPEHETLIGDGAHGRQDPETESWQCPGVRAWIFHIEYLPLEVRRRLRVMAPLFRRKHSRTTAGAYWTNHCAHCGASQGDYFLHCEPDVAFMPMSAQAAAPIRLERVDQPIGAYACGQAQDPPFFEALSGL